MFKRKKNENGEEYETKFEVFMRNYNTVPGFKELVKLTGYAIFIIVFMVLAANAVPKESKASDETKTTTTTTTEVSVKKVYGDILNGLREDGKSVEITIKEGTSTYTIEGKNENNTFTGYYNDINGSKKFVIKGNDVYEKTLTEEVMNNTLFGNIDIDFLVPLNLVNLLTKNTALKTLKGDTTEYVYDITKNNIDYKVTTYIKDSKCNKIEVTSSGINYLMTYK